MSSINRQPAGVLGFLGIKNTGRNPDALSTTLVPTWDMTDFYLENACEISNLAGTWDAAGTVSSFSPPPGEAWYVHNYGVRTDVIGARTVNGVLTIAAVNGVGVVPLITQPARAAAATERLCLGIDREFILPPGFTLGAFVAEFVGAAGLVVNYAIRFTRLSL